MKNLKKIFAIAMSVATVAMSTSAFAQVGNSAATYTDGVASLVVDAVKDPTFVAEEQMTVVIVPKNLGEITAADIQYINQDAATGFTTILAGMGTKDTINPADYEIRVGGTNITDVWVFSFEELVKVVYGDADGNEAIELDDAIEIMKHVGGLITLSENAQNAADVDGVEGLELDDAITVMKYVGGLISSFPVEG